MIQLSSIASLLSYSDILVSFYENTRSKTAKTNPPTIVKIPLRNGFDLLLNIQNDETAMNSRRMPKTNVNQCSGFLLGVLWRTISLLNGKASSFTRYSACRLTY